MALEELWLDCNILVSLPAVSVLSASQRPMTLPEWGQHMAATFYVRLSFVAGRVTCTVLILTLNFHLQLFSCSTTISRTSACWVYLGEVVSQAGDVSEFVAETCFVSITQFVGQYSVLSGCYMDIHTANSFFWRHYGIRHCICRQCFVYRFSHTSYQALLFDTCTAVWALSAMSLFR